MNYKPYLSWGVFGGSNATQRANGIASWGLRLSLAAAVASAKRRLGLLMGVY